MNKLDLHERLIELKQELSESCGLTEGDFEYRNQIRSEIVEIQLQLYK